MKRKYDIAPVVALCAALVLGACSSTSQIGTAVNVASVLPATSSLVASANTTLANIAPTVSAACGVISVAEGYFANVKLKVSATTQKVEAAAQASVANICSNPPSNVTSAISDLANEWAIIQAATTVN